MFEESSNYATKRIKEALELSNGNYASAHRLLLSWLADDDLLIKTLAIPHLKSIVGYALQEYIKSEDKKSFDSTEVAQHPVELKTTATMQDDSNDLEIGDFGRAMLANMGGTANSQNFGFTAESELEPPAKTSKRHIDAIMQIAKKKEY